MKKFILSVMLMVAAIGIMVELVFCSGKDIKRDAIELGETSDDESSMPFETLSDKDIYFHPDMVMPDNPVVRDMIDLANAYAILRAGYCDAELYLRFGMLVGDVISKMDANKILDMGTQASARDYIHSLAKAIPRDTMMWKENDSARYHMIRKSCNEFGDRLVQRYALERYGTMTEKDTEEYFDINQFIPNYDSIFNLRADTISHARYLKGMAEQTMSFDRRCIYTIEYAAHVEGDEKEQAVEMLEDLMTSGQFSRYLHQVWRVWRCLKQMAESPSRDGIIRNLEYNRMRYRCLNTILRRVAADPKDIKAINDFCFLASFDNITRYGESVFGNSVLMEYLQLFPLMDDD